MTAIPNDETSRQAIADELKKYIRDNDITCHMVTVIPEGFKVHLDARLDQTEKARVAIRRKLGAVTTISQAGSGIITVMNHSYGARIKP